MEIIIRGHFVRKIIIISVSERVSLFANGYFEWSEADVDIGERYTDYRTMKI